MEIWAVGKDVILPRAKTIRNMKRFFILTFTTTAALTSMAQNEVPDTLVTTQHLHEVVVKGEKPQIKGHDGIMVVDLPNM